MAVHKTKTVALTDDTHRRLVELVKWGEPIEAVIVRALDSLEGENAKMPVRKRKTSG